MDSWQIILFDIFLMLSSQQQAPKALTPQQQQQFEIAFTAGNFKVPEGGL